MCKAEAAFFAYQCVLHNNEARKADGTIVCGFDTIVNLNYEK